LLNIYKKDDFNKDIVLPATIQIYWPVLEGTDLYPGNPEKPVIPDKISSFTQKDSRLTVRKND
jgi:hypothetical protein